MNKLLNYKTKTKNATPPIFTEIVALFFFTNCQRWDYIICVNDRKGFCIEYFVDISGALEVYYNSM